MMKEEVFPYEKDYLMTSFDYAYKLEAVRDWLFEQSK